MLLICSFALLAFLGYVIGSVSFAVLVSKAMSLPSPYTYGSENPGATNVLRTGNKVAAFLTFFGDSMKGCVAVLMLPLLFTSDSNVSGLSAPIVFLFVFLGHVFPLFHRFKGGKGVATAIGGLFGLDFLIGTIAVAVWLLVAVTFRYSSLSALLAAVVSVPVSFVCLDTAYQALFVILVSMVLIFRHRKNISNLLKGDESKIGSTR